YNVRVKEVRFLVRLAAATSDIEQAVAHSKAAAVLAAAALERYVNDLVVEYCTKLKVDTWNELSEGQQQYMARQLATVLYRPARRIHRRNEVAGRQRNRLRQAVTQCFNALQSPANWPHGQEYGMFMDGAAEPGRIDSTLRAFDQQGRSVFAFAEAR